MNSAPEEDSSAIMSGMDAPPAVLIPNTASNGSPTSARAPSSAAVSSPASAPSRRAATSAASPTPAAALSNSTSQSLLPDVLSNELCSLDLHATENGALSGIGFLLLDQEENIQVGNAEELAQRLGCGNGGSSEVAAEGNDRSKVVAVIGNTGEGKSYALNHSLFNGEEVFETSSDQRSCTLGVRAAYQPMLQAVVLDTEGMMGDVTPVGASSADVAGAGNGDANEVLRRRMLLKVLALSDVVILCTKAERIPNDLFLFLGDASKTYTEHFSPELRRLSNGDEQVYTSLKKVTLPTHIKRDLFLHADWPFTHRLSRDEVHRGSSVGERAGQKPRDCDQRPPERARPRRLRLRSDPLRGRQGGARGLFGVAGAASRFCMSRAGIEWAAASEL